MAATFVKVSNSEVVSDYHHRNIAYDVTLDSSYPTGGYAGALGLIGVPLSQVESVSFNDNGNPPSGYDFDWNYTTGKIQVYRSGAASIQSGTVTLVAGSGTVTVPSGSVAVVTDTSATGNTYKASVSGTTLTITSSLGTDTGTIAYLAMVPGSGLNGSEVGSGSNLSSVSVRVSFRTTP